jgi:Endonuclease/Exonuclease/phosphatase family
MMTDPAPMLATRSSRASLPYRPAIFGALCLALTPLLSHAAPFAVVAYNVENLHDVDGIAIYDDYQPAVYTPAHLAVKLANITKVLARVNQGAGPEIVVFNEIELDQTPDSKVPDYDAWLASVADTTAAKMLAQTPLPPAIAGLPAEAWLLKACADAGLGPYHLATSKERPGSHEDGRGAAIRNLIFSRFPITAVKSTSMLNARDIVEATLDVNGYPLTILANHWKSGASDPELETIRRDNARTVRARLDALLQADPNADVIVAGDLNSHYNQKQRYRDMGTTGINDILGSQGNELALRGKSRDLYNLWFELPSDQRGSDIFRGEWGTLMHLILTRGLYDQNGVQYEDGSFAVMKLTGLNCDALGLPIRWARGATPAGFSDHFPLYARFRTVDTNAKDKWQSLTGPSETEEGPGKPVPVATTTVDLFANALKIAELPAAANIRDGSYNGRVFYIEAPASVNEKGWVKVTVAGQEYDVFSHDKELRATMRQQAKSVAALRFYGELGQFKGNWQFLVHGKEWLR